MPVIMKSPKNHDEVLDAERLRQIARRKEQNRNAQRRLRERKEEYTMQLEAQLAELHRRSQSQEEESHYLREALSRMRAENQTLAEQITLIHQAVPSTQASHPLPQRASIDLGIDPFAHTASLNRHRNRSQSATASTMPPFAFGPTAAPWSTSLSHLPMSAMHTPFGIAPGATHRLPFQTASPLPGTSSYAGGLPLGHNEPIEDESMPRSEVDSRRSSLSPISQRKDSLFASPFDSRGTISRHGSGQTDLTVPPEHSDSESLSSSKIQRSSGPSSALALSIASNQNLDSKHGTSTEPPASDEVMASCLESIHTLPLSNAEAIKQAQVQASHRSNYDNAAPWMSSSSEVPSQLALADFRQSDMSNMPKSLGVTPGALGLTNAVSGTGAGGDGWSISPWIHMTQTPSVDASADTDISASRSHANNSLVDSGMVFDSRKSLATRRGFSGSLKLESRAA